MHQKILPIYRASALSLALLFCAHAAASDDSAATLAGTWSGTWTDTRPGVRGAGGDFSCVAERKDADTFTATFTVNKNKIFKVELHGKSAHGEILFDTTASLGAYYGLYTLKARIAQDTFTGEYSGQDEKGTIKMTRTVGPKK